MKILIDAMGGDNAPQEIVKGALLAHEKFGAEIVLIGQKEKIESCLEGEYRPEIVDAREIITFIAVNLVTLGLSLLLQWLFREQLHLDTWWMRAMGENWFTKLLNGERFCNESVPYDFILHAAYMEPHHLYNTIYDSTWMDQIAQFKQIGCARIIPSPTGGKLHIFSPEAEVGLLMGMQQAGFVQQADTIEELAEKLNIPVDTFVATVNRYNELCEKGEDEDFGKEAYRMLPIKQAPFYGCRQGASLLCTLDGLRINTKMQVLDKNGEVIDGLYAAGDCSGGFFAHNYPEYIVGVAVGRTLTEGYLLGAELAE